MKRVNGVKDVAEVTPSQFVIKNVQNILVKSGRVDMELNKFSYPRRADLGGTKSQMDEVAQRKFSDLAIIER